MATKMALPISAGAVFGLTLFVDRQSIKLRTDQDRRTAFAAVINRGDAMAAEIRKKLVGLRLLQESADAPRCFLFFAGDFRMTVQIMAKLNEIEHVLVGQKHQKSLQVVRPVFPAATYRALPLMQNLWRMPAFARRFRLGSEGDDI